MITLSILLNEIRRIWIQPLVWVVLGITFVIIALFFLVLLNNFYLEVQTKFAGSDNPPGVTDSVFHPMLFWSTIIGALMMPVITLRSITEEKILAILAAARTGVIMIINTSYISKCNTDSSNGTTVMVLAVVSAGIGRVQEIIPIAVTAIVLFTGFM